MGNDNAYDYWARRAAEERLIAAGLPDGPAAIAHRRLAELYERASLDLIDWRRGLHLAVPRND